MATRLFPSTALFAYTTLLAILQKKSRLKDGLNLLFS